MTCLGRAFTRGGKTEPITLPEILYPTARVVRGQSLVDAALNKMISSEVYKCSLPQATQHHAGAAEMCGDSEIPSEDPTVPDEAYMEQNESQAEKDPDEPNEDLKQSPERTRECTVDNDDLHQATELLERMIKNEISITEIEDSTVLKRMEEKINQAKDKMRNSWTARLWLQYMDMIEILWHFILAERLGNWKLHLTTLSEMLPYLALDTICISSQSTYTYKRCSNLSMNNLPHSDSLRMVSMSSEEVIAVGLASPQI